MIKTTIFSVLFMVTSIFCDAQYSDVYLENSAKYPDENQLQLKAENKVVLSLEDGEVVIRHHISDEFMRLHQEKKIQLRDRIFFAEFKKVDNVKASVFNFKNGKYREEKIKDFTIKDELTDNFYDDQKSINFTYPGVHAGSKTTLEYDVTIQNPRFLRSFYLANYFPIKNFILEMVVDNNIALDFIFMNTDSISLEYSKIDKGKNTIYTWKLAESDAVAYQSNSIDPRYTFPHIIPVVKYFVENGDTTQILESTQDLYNWYQSLVSGINQEPCDKNLSLLVDSLTLDKTSDYDKVKSIYYWTQKNIKYVAFEDGLGGFIPREANEVYNKKYGDCKDNSSILQQMMKEAGLLGHLTWIGTRDIPYSYDEVHSPAVDNHMILTYIDGEKVYFLDATGRFLDLNMPSSFIQGKEALIGINEHDYKIIEVPIVPNEKNQINHSEEIVIKNDSIFGTASRTYSGYEKINLFRDLERTSTADELNLLLINELRCGNNSFGLDNISETNKYNYDKDYQISYSYEISNHVKKIGDAMYINLNLHQDDIRNLNSTEPFKTSIEFTHLYLVNYSTKLLVPKDYTVKSLPKNLIIQNELCEININYEFDGKTVNYSQEFKTKFLTLDIQQQNELQDVLKKIKKKYKDTVVLEIKK